MLHTSSLAFKTGNEMKYRGVKYGLEKTITAAKKQQREAGQLLFHC